MHYDVRHRTHYQYSAPVSLAHNQAHLALRSTPFQNVLASSLTIRPTPSVLDEWRDHFGNVAHYFTLEEPHDEFEITATSHVDVIEPNWPAPASTPTWEETVEVVRYPADDAALEAAQYTFESPRIRRLNQAADYARESFPAGRPLLAALLDLTARIHRDFRYVPGATTSHTSTAEVFAQRRGVCQDFAHLQITCLRTLGLAARYVSGYLLTDPPPGQPKLIGADASHAWVSVYCPGFGWLDFDPTNNAMPRLRHVTVAWGRDYSDVCPVQGIFLGGGQHTIVVAVDVAPRP